MGMLMRLAIFSQTDKPESIHEPSSLTRAELATILGFTELHLENPRWAIVEGGYAAGFGSVVSLLTLYTKLLLNTFLQANLSAHPPFRDHATGNLAVEVKLTNMQKPELSAMLQELKQQGCIGVIVEIVCNQADGRVMSPDELYNLSKACQECGLMLAIDETITALRCGAPFAYQRPEYENNTKPDLVFFGKALSAQGIAINFDGPYMSRLGIDVPLRKRQAVLDWQAVVTKAVILPVLFDAIGILEMATAGNWVERGKVIGKNLREMAFHRAQVMKEQGGDDELEIIGGLDGFIFVHRAVAATFLVMGAFIAGKEVKWVRWLPRMDRNLTDKQTVESIMSETGAGKRRLISECFERDGLRPQWCFFCGTWARGTDYPWCRACCIDTCDSAECIRQLQAHSCLG
jgi:hypothetical protein